MGRVWALAGAIIGATTIVFLLQDFVDSGTLLTMGLCVGGGAVAAYLPGGAYLSRGMWLFIGVIIGTLGFVLGAAAFPDTDTGLWLGGIVPVFLLALLTMWTKRQSNLLAGVIGSGAMAGVYANVFNLDPQSINISAPIAIGQTMVPLGLGYLAGMLIVLFVSTDAEVEAEKAAADEAGAGDSEADTSDQTELEDVR